MPDYYRKIIRLLPIEPKYLAQAYTIDFKIRNEDEITYPTMHHSFRPSLRLLVEVILSPFLTDHFI
jgi:hypothetical protein